MFAVMHAVNVSVCLNVRVAGNYTMLLIQYENSRRVSRLAVEQSPQAYECFTLTLM